MDASILGINVKDMFIPGIGILEKIIRPVIIYFLFIIGLRIGGKREMAQMSTFDMVVLIMLANAVQNSIIGNDNSLTGGVIGAGMLLAVNSFMAWLIYNNKHIERIFVGNPDVLIRSGKIRMDRLKKERITLEELKEAAHKQGIANLADVEKAVLDPDGAILFEEKDPSAESLLHQDLVKRLELISAQVEELREELAKPR